MPSRVLYAHNSADLYGASRSLLRLLRVLDRAEFVPIVLMPEEGPLAIELRAMDVRVIIYSRLSIITREIFHSWRLVFFLLNIPLSVRGVWAIIRREKVDLVHTNTGTILSAAPAAFLAARPHVWHVRDWFQEFVKYWRIYEPMMRRFSRCIITVSEPVAAQFSDRKKVRVIHNGFDPAEFALTDSAAGARFRAQYDLGDGLVVGCVGRIKLLRKGQEVLLRAAALLAKRGIRAKFLIVGAPYPGNESHLADLRKIVRASGLDGDVVFTGELADARPAYAAMDIVALPSAQPEPFGGVVMEAMSMGLPVIATGIGGSIEQVIDGETGYLVQPGDPAALAERLERLLGNEVLRRSFGDAGRRRVVEKFSVERMTGEIVRVYRECLGSTVGGNQPGVAAGEGRSIPSVTSPARTPVKILYVHNSADIYGASRCLLRLLKGLDRTRYFPLVLLPEHGPLEEHLSRLGTEVIQFPQLSTITRGVFHSWKLIPFLFNLPLSVFALRRILLDRDIGLIHTNTGVMLTPGPAAWLAGIPHMWHIRDWFQEFRSFWKVYRKYIHHFSSRIIASSVPIVEQFPAHYHVLHLQDGMEMEEFVMPGPETRSAFRQEYGLGDGPVVGVFGRIKLVRKGQEILLQAAVILRQRGISAKYLIVGAPFPGNESHLEEMKAIVTGGGIQDSVVFTGELRDPRPAYSAIDISVLTSGQPEPFGGVVMEAMCMGLPVIATNIGGSIEQVADGETGFLVPPCDPAALADKLEILLADEALRKRFGAAAKRRIIEHFPLSGMVAKVQNLYDEHLSIHD